MSTHIGVYLCRCGTNVADVVDIQAVAGFARELPHVTVVRESGFLCSDSGQKLIQEDVRELGLGRVVVGACSPLMHEATFRRACHAGGLNPHNLQMANIREQVSWVTPSVAVATRKSKSLISAAVQRVGFHEPLEVRRAKVNPTVLVVGGGITGVEAALRLAEAGQPVVLVERQPNLGGHMGMLARTFPTLDCAACILVPKMAKAAEHPNIRLLTCSEVTAVDGFVGQFNIQVRTSPRYIDVEQCNGCGACLPVCPRTELPLEHDQGLGTRSAIYFPSPQPLPALPLIDSEHCDFLQDQSCGLCADACPADAVDFGQRATVHDFEVGAILIATGFDVFDPRRTTEYGYGRWRNVLTSLQFERLCHPSGPTQGQILLDDGRPPRRIGILHCVGSRDHRFNPECSDVCCMTALKLALMAREHTGAVVHSFYIDMRVSGKHGEAFYEQAQRAGVVFIRGKGSEVIYRDNQLLVKAEDPVLGRRIMVPVDMVVLAVGAEARQDSLEVARLFGIGCTEQGFFTERHPKFAPVETAADGIFIAGGCQGPKDITQSLTQGGAAAAALMQLVGLGHVEILPVTAEVDPSHCTACWVCLQDCPYGAIGKADGPSARVEAVRCKGCGSCAATCPAGAIRQLGFTREQILAEVEGLLAAEVDTPPQCGLPPPAD